MGHHLGTAAYTGCYRIRSERRRIRDKKTHRDKQLLKLDRELGSLYEQHRRLPLVPLNPPVQRGWVRSFVLREDVARSKEAAFYEAILAKINTETYCYRKDFKRAEKRKGKKAADFKDQRVRKLYEWEFKQAGFTPRQQACFEERISIKNRCVCKTFHFKEKWRFVARVRPRLITTVRTTDPELQSQIDRIRSVFQNNARNGRRYRLKGYGRPWWKPDVPGSYVYEYTNKPLHVLLGLIAEEQRAAPNMNL